MGILLKGPAIKSKIVVFILLLITGVVVYYNSFYNGFHFDDVHHIVNNIYIRSVKNIPLFFIDGNTFSYYGSGHYRPLLLVSYAINYYFGRLNPEGYHIVNIALHAGTAFLVFLIIEAMFGEKVAAGFSLRMEQEVRSKKIKVRNDPLGASNFNTGFFTALAASLIFLVHPFNSEAVNYISARSTIMSSFFYLLAFYLWIKYRGQKSEISEIKNLHSSIYYFASLLAAIFAMLSKEIAITLPVILWLYDLYYVPISFTNIKTNTYRRYIKQFIPYIPYLILVVAPIVLLRLFVAGYVVSEGEPSRAYYLHLLMEAKVLVSYFYLLFFPVKLSIEHAISEVYFMLDWKVLGSVLILLLIVGLGLYHAKSGKPEVRIISFYIFWFFITMLPTTLIPLNAPLQENRGYLSSVGFATFLGVVINRFAWQSNYRTIIKNSILILTLMLFSIITYERNTVWKEDFTLWLDAVQKSPMSWRAHHNLAVTFEKSGLDTLAIGEYKKIVEIKSDYHTAMNRIGNIHLKRRELDLAITAFKQAARMKPTDFKSHMNLARVYLKLEQVDLARKECNAILKLGKLLKEENEFTSEAKDCISWLDFKKDNSNVQ